MKSSTGADVNSQQKHPVKILQQTESHQIPTVSLPGHSTAFLNNGQPKKVVDTLYDPA